MAYSDFYEGQSEMTAEVLKKLNMYVALAIDNGDAVYQSKPGELTITVRIKKEKPDAVQDNQSK